MKLAYLANVPLRFERAHSAQITHMCQAFAESGVGVTLFINKFETKTLDDIATAFAIQPKFSLQQVAPRRFFGASVLGFIVREVCFVTSLLLGKSLRQYDILYSRHEVLLALLSFVLSSRKIVYESHEAKFNWAVKRLIKQNVPLVVISQGIYDAYIEKGVSPTQMIVADDAVDPSFFAPTDTQKTARQRLGIKEDMFTVMYIGGFAAWKGIDTFLALSDVLTDCHVVAIGGTSEQIQEKARQFPKATLLGNKPYRDLPNNQIAADVLVIPNTADTDLSSKYTSPLKLFAHMASGVPIVMSDIQSLTTVVPTDHVTLVAPDNVAALAEAIELVRTEMPTKQISASQVKQAATAYTWENRVATIKDFIQIYAA